VTFSREIIKKGSWIRCEGLHTCSDLVVMGVWMQVQRQVGRRCENDKKGRA
jgi:hypothetical protein